MKILCREIDKYEGRRPAHYIVKHEVTGSDLVYLDLRSRLNPELNYYVTRLDEQMTDEEILVLFKQKKYRKEPFFMLLTRW